MNNKFYEKCHTGSLYDINDPELQKLENSIDFSEFQPLKKLEIHQKLKKVLIFYLGFVNFFIICENPRKYVKKVVLSA